MASFTTNVPSLLSRDITTSEANSVCLSDGTPPLPHLNAISSCVSALDGSDKANG